MQRSGLWVGVLVVFLASGCASGPERHRAILRCEHPWQGQGFMSCFSFGEASLDEVRGSEQVDLVYYFDPDDCQGGALLGHDDCPGYLYPVGRKQLKEAAALGSPPPDAESPAAISPLTKDLEGQAFGVRTAEGEFVLIRIVKVQPASHADLVQGMVPALELEWVEPKASGRR